MLLVDQYRAHLRILFDRYMRAMQNADTPAASQRVMFADPIRLDASQENLLNAVLPHIRSLGFVIDQAAEGEWRIDAVPTPLNEQNGREIILKIISTVADGTADYGEGSLPDTTELMRRVALAAARNAAIHGGQVLSPSEMEHLLGDLLALPDPRYTPDGNPVMRTVTTADLAALLKP